MLKAPVDTKYIDRLKNNILQNNYSLNTVNRFRILLNDSHCIHTAEERKELFSTIDSYNKDLFFRHIAGSQQLSNELKKIDCFVTFCSGKYVGSVVANCNPFTLGHLHLITKASQQVDVLFVFVLQEDKSFFPFIDRFLLALKNLIKLKNVIVIPSGKFIISSSTFPDYFGKDITQDIKIDASRDLEIFSNFIAPKLGISVRFVGHEPFCAVTNQYNQQMLTILPQHGINVIQIDRLEVDSIPISASRVRHLLEKNKFDELKKIVSDETLSYLKCFNKRAPIKISAEQLLNESITSFAQKLYNMLTTDKRLEDATVVASYLEKISEIVSSPNDAT